MIKLIISDLDGTLLSKGKHLPPDFDEVFNELNKKGIAFATATGRNFAGVQDFFGNIVDKMHFICDNGAFVMHHDKLVQAVTIEKEMSHRIFNAVKKYGGIDVLACGKKGTYYTHCLPQTQEIMNDFYTKTTFVDDLCDIDDEFFKISINDFNDPLKSGSYQYFVDNFGNDLSINASGDIWMDAMCKNVNKGIGVDVLQKLLGVTKEETMIFGDYYNDIPMLDRAEYSFAMATAPDDVKAHCKYIADRSESFGVTKAIKEFVLN